MQQRPIQKYGIAGGGIYAQKESPGLDDLLAAERGQYGKALRGQRPQGMDAPHPERQGGLQAGQLLIPQDAQFAHVP